MPLAVDFPQIQNSNYIKIYDSVEHNDKWQIYRDRQHIQSLSWCRSSECTPTNGKPVSVQRQKEHTIKWQAHHSVEEH